MLKLPSRFVAYFMLAVAQFMVGINIVGSKYLLPTTPESMILFFRFFVATIVLIFLHVTTNHKRESLAVLFKSLTRQDILFLLAQSLCAGVLFNLLLLWGLQYTDANVAGIITSALPAMITLFSAFFLRERLKVFNALCVVFAVLGLVLLNMADFHVGGRCELIGAFIILMALIPEAAYYILVKIHVVRLPLFFVSALINAINIPVLLLILAITGPHDWHLSLFNWFILFLVALSSAIFYVLWNRAVQVIRDATSGLFTAFMPISTLVIASIFLGESINLLQITGMVLVLISIILNTLA